MDHQYDQILAGLLRHGNDDDVGLWQIMNRVSKLLNIRQEKLTDTEAEQFWDGLSKLITLMLQNGFIAVNLTRDGGYIAWPEQNAKQVLAQIRNEWVKLKGKFPDVGFIVWFHKTKSSGEQP